MVKVSSTNLLQNEWWILCRLNCFYFQVLQVQVCNNRADGRAHGCTFNNPSLNRNIGKFHLPHIWMRFCLTPQNSNSSKTLGNNICHIDMSTCSGHSICHRQKNISLHLLQMVQTICGLTSSTKLAITSANIHA